ncbi:bifunctional YncE family protein/alkaline phosphatase family protein [Paenibacillus filicis]|uniref:Bifunctional YncE family protein/alkaline phosphatase family protein n=1 Tax=Paenibacillus gyeongsangnamensis TaxID=3388067 RepID=A0ABT4QLS5_9BACL|nr:bifunctional YncE family protein/alkaline phosphatase family protein [Paenibacillus filicis]MCZ8517828.1 bifunctional YncE family protein/alkaline phosphatase family protein [Paenibacillus filicis]
MKKISKKISAIALAATVVGSGTAMASYNIVAGPQSDNTGVNPHGWTLTPAGKQINLGDFPMGGSLSPDHHYLVVSNDGQGTQSLQVVDIQKQQVVQTIPYTNSEGLYLGTAFSPDGKTFYASAGGNNKIRVFQFANGTLTEQSPILLKEKTQMGISISPDGKFLFVANNESNSVSKIDLASKQVVATAAVGKDPYTAQISQDGKALYVSNWGESSVTVLNPQDLSVEKTISVGLHPNAIAVNPMSGYMYVSDSDSDQISVIDPKQEQVIQTISLAPYKDAVTGSQPDALTVSPDGKTLYVANAGNNDVAVVDLAKNTVQGLIPTAWYPTGVYVNGGQLMVLNAKGLGAGPNTQNQYIGNMMQGTMSFINLPDSKQLKQYTDQVNDNNQVAKVHGDGWFSSLTGNKNDPIPRSDGEKSPIKHVIYVIRENKTYDQVFGDMPKGNGDPSLVQYGKNITPNAHKLANQFVLLDNLYTDGEVSDSGHIWAIGADSNDYSEKTWLPDYSDGRKTYGVDVPALKPKNGYLWDSANRAGVSFRDYGEYINYWTSPGYDRHGSTRTDGDWKPDDPAIGSHYDPNFPGWNYNISDMDRYHEWEKEFKQFEQNDSLPQFEMVYLPNDHTVGTKPGKLTPQAMVAQNDLALGSLVDTVSHSKDWKDTAIFVVEDDPQGGSDHVDAHRTAALVISPYTQKGSVDSTLYDQDSMIRTMEMILGMKPLNQYDASAIPMLNSFTNHPNFTQYNVEQETYPITAINGQNAPMAAIMQQQDFSQPDKADRDKLYRANWLATKGNQPYPEFKK